MKATFAVIAAMALEAAALPNPEAQAPDISTMLAGNSALSSLSSGLSPSRNDIKSGSYQCKKIALLFARGTGEIGNLGTVVGPVLTSELNKKFPNDVLVQGSDYSTIFTNGAATDFAKWVPEIKAKCPNTHVVLSGYSQGAMNVHSALSKLGAAGNQVSAAVTFGDPYGNMGFASGGIAGTFMGLGGSSSFNPQNGLSLCATTDFVCAVMPNWNIGSKAQGNWSKTSNSAFSHLSYIADDSTTQAANFIAKVIGGGGAAPVAPAAGAAPAAPAAASPLAGLSGLTGGSGGLGALSGLSSGKGLGGLSGGKLSGLLSKGKGAAAPAVAAPAADTYA